MTLEGALGSVAWVVLVLLCALLIFPLLRLVMSFMLHVPLDVDGPAIAASATSRNYHLCPSPRLPRTQEYKYMAYYSFLYSLMLLESLCASLEWDGWVGTAS